MPRLVKGFKLMQRIKMAGEAQIKRMEQISATDFPDQYEYQGHRIEFTGTTKVGQDGPKIGKLLIDDKELLPDQYFSGPLIFFRDLLFAPIACRSLFTTKFKLVSIHLDTFHMTTLGPETGLILLEKIENGKLYFFTDLKNSKRRNIKMPV
jgi:hypothetical protein